MMSMLLLLTVVYYAACEERNQQSKFFSTDSIKYNGTRGEQHAFVTTISKKVSEQCTVISINTVIEDKSRTMMIELRSSIVIGGLIMEFIDAWVKVTHVCIAVTFSTTAYLTQSMHFRLSITVSGDLNT